MNQIVKNLETYHLHLSSEISHLISEMSYELALLGGPDSLYVQEKILAFKEILSTKLNSYEKSMIEKYIHREIPYLVLEGLNIKKLDRSKIDITQSTQLPSLEILEKDIDILTLASSEQIILALLEEDAFAFDIDNVGKIVRVVANLKGGGATKIENENPDKSSHSGIELTAHTEAPYHTVTKVVNNHSPAPSSLILTARWNPLNEPTSLIPISRVLSQLTIEEILALTTESFNFTRSETFNEGQGSGGENVSILEVDKYGYKAMKYNSYRFTPNENASIKIKNAFYKFESIVRKTSIVNSINLNPNTVLIINNSLCLHCRDVIKDNRRTLVRLFGYRKNLDYIVLQKNPLIVKG
ncbi:hypothetical protein [Acinetobacter sp. M5A5_2a]